VLVEGKSMVSNDIIAMDWSKVRGVSGDRAGKSAAKTC
jgi:hypothetical protein